METLDSGLMDFFVGQRYFNAFPPPAIGLKSYQSFMGFGGEPWFASELCLLPTHKKSDRSRPGRESRSASRSPIWWWLI
jgi:hypothetical protein